MPGPGCKPKTARRMVTRQMRSASAAEKSRRSSLFTPRLADVLGAWMLSILSDYKRYAHVAAMRCDGVNSCLLGCKAISEDVLRRALPRILQVFRRSRFALGLCLGDF